MDDVTRRTRLAAERTWLAWWRTALGASVAGLAVGRLVPEVIDSGGLAFGLLGVGYALLAVAMFAVAEHRRRALEAAMDRGEYASLGDRTALALTAVAGALAVATVVLLLVTL